MSVGNLRDHDEIKQRIADCRERLRRSRAAQRTTAAASRETEASAARDAEDEDATYAGELLAEEEAKV